MPHDGYKPHSVGQPVSHSYYNYNQQCTRICSAQLPRILRLISPNIRLPVSSLNESLCLLRAF